MTIDGTTQPGYSGKPLIVLDGAGAGPGANGLTITGDGVTVKGLIIGGFSSDGIEITANDDLIESCYIGTDFTGTKAIGNGGAGVAVTGGGTHNTIGGTTAGAGNVISGNAGDGIDDIGANSNLIAGNSSAPPADEYRRGRAKHGRRSGCHDELIRDPRRNVGRCGQPDLRQRLERRGDQRFDGHARRAA